MYNSLKRLILGTPISSSDEHHTRLGRPVALTVFASDAISSTAYATEEILLVLVPVVGLAALGDLVPISIVVALLLTIVVFSYRQTIFAYPSGGGSYVVSRENLGETPSLVAGAALLIDYTLTVAVSTSAGIAAVTSAIEPLRPYRIALCLGAVGFILVANLRGAKESGRLFAPPVYTYIVSLALLIGYGLYRVFVEGLEAMEPNEHALEELTQGSLGPLTLFLLMRAFSSGAVALTGVEAISNGVPAFKKPESKNAAATLVTMAVILGTFFLGISVLADHIKPTVLEPGSTDYQTLLSIMGEYVYGGKTVLYYILQFSTFAILILAANTAFADFPRVTSIIARDGFMPRQLTNRGDRLVFSNGIVLLGIIAGSLIVAFGGETNALIPLYAVGVFTGFTLSQSGMVRHHKALQEPGWRRNMIINGIGACATGIVLLVVVVSKFTIGAWIPVVLIPIIVLAFRSIHRHYQRVTASLAVPPDYRPPAHRHTVVVLVGGVHRGVLDALAYARSLAPDRLLAVTVVTNAEEHDKVQQQWEQFEVPIDLRIIHDPYRELTLPVIRLLDELDADWSDDIVTVVLPEFVLNHWWEGALHNQSALQLKTALRQRPNTVVVAIPTLIEPKRRREPERPSGDDGGEGERDRRIASTAEPPAPVDD